MVTYYKLHGYIAKSTYILWGSTDDSSFPGMVEHDFLVFWVCTGLRNGLTDFQDLLPLQPNTLL
jgi:hypothetical protein